MGLLRNLTTPDSVQERDELKSNQNAVGYSGEESSTFRGEHLVCAL